MPKILIGILGFLATILVSLFLLFFDKCYFDEHEKCPLSWATAEADTPDTRKPVFDDTKPRGPDIKLVSDSPIINYIYRAGGTGEPKVFGEGSVLHSGDAYKILFEPAKDGYVYIFQMDSAHKLFRLFPTNDFKNSDPNNINPVKKGQHYFVPAENWSFKLDNTTGEETIYFVITNQPDPTLENDYQSMLAQQEISNFQDRLTARQKWHTTMKSRGPEVELMADKGPSRSPIQFQENGQQFSVMPQFLKNMCEGCVYIVNFEHR